MTEAYIDQLGAAIEDSRKVRDFGAAIERLQKSGDFRAVVLKGYLEQEAIRLVQARTDSAMQKPEQQADLMRQIDAIACFKDFLRTRLMLAEHARGAIEEAESLREEVMAEELS